MVLFLIKIHWNFMPVDIQINYYKIIIRMALIYGLKIIPLNKSDYKKLDRLQHSYITTILGINLRSDDTSARILLGAPKLSDFLIKLKLSMWYDILKQYDNTFTFIIKCNYSEILQEYISNNYSFKGIKNQWAFIASDFINTLNYWNIDQKYIHINNLPESKNEWMKLVNNHYNETYRKELKHFLSNHGLILTTIFGIDVIMKKYNKKIYHGLLSELKALYNNDISTSKLKKSIKLLFKWSSCNWKSLNSNPNTLFSSNQDKFCPLCGSKRNNFLYHLVWVCNKVEKKTNLQWFRNNDFTNNIIFLEGVQTKITGALSLKDV